MLPCRTVAVSCRHQGVRWLVREDTRPGPFKGSHPSEFIQQLEETNKTHPETPKSQLLCPLKIQRSHKTVLDTGMSTFGANGLNGDLLFHGHPGEQRLRTFPPTNSNPFEKYVLQIGSFPQVRRENIKYFFNYKIRLPQKNRAEKWPSLTTVTFTQKTMGPHMRMGHRHLYGGTGVTTDCEGLGAKSLMAIQASGPISPNKAGTFGSQEAIGKKLKKIIEKHGLKTKNIKIKRRSVSQNDEITSLFLRDSSKIKKARIKWLATNSAGSILHMQK